MGKRRIIKTRRRKRLYWQAHQAILHLITNYHWSTALAQKWKGKRMGSMETQYQLRAAITPDYAQPDKQTDLSGISLDWQLKIDNCWLELDVRRLGGCVWLALKQVNASDDDEAEDEAAPDGNGNVRRPLPRHVRGVQCLTQCSSSGQDKWASCWSDNGDEAEDAEHSCLGVALRCRRSCQWRLRKAFDVGRQFKLSAFLVAFSWSMLNFPSDCRVVFLEYVSLCLSPLPPLPSLLSIFLFTFLCQLVFLFLSLFAQHFHMLMLCVCVLLMLFS